MSKQPASERVLAQGWGMSYALWQLVDEGDHLVLRPTPFRISSIAWLLALFIAFGIGFTVLFAKLAGGWTAFVPIPLMIVVSVLNVVIFRYAAHTDVEQGPALIWDRTTDEVRLPRANVDAPRRDLVCFEYHRGWTRLGATLTLLTELHLVIRVEGKHTTYPVITGVSRLKRFAAALSTEMKVPVERLD
jgi:hypothetical protein